MITPSQPYLSQQNKHRKGLIFQNLNSPYDNFDDAWNVWNIFKEVWMKNFWKWERQVNSGCDDLKWRQFSPRIEPVTFDARISQESFSTKHFLSENRIHQILMAISKACSAIAGSICP